MVLVCFRSKTLQNQSFILFSFQNLPKPMVLIRFRRFLQVLTYFLWVSNCFNNHFPETSRKCPGSFPDISLALPGKIWELSGHFPETFRNNARNFPDISRTFQEISRAFPGHFRTFTGFFQISLCKSSRHSIAIPLIFLITVIIVMTVATISFLNYSDCIRDPQY